MTTARDRVLAALQAAGPRGCFTGVLCLPNVGGARFGARIKELRDRGYQIDAQYVRPGCHLYILDPAVKPASPLLLSSSGGEADLTAATAPGDLKANAQDDPSSGAVVGLFDADQVHAPQSAYDDLGDVA